MRDKDSYIEDIRKARGFLKTLKAKLIIRKVLKPQDCCYFYDTRTIIINKHPRMTRKEVILSLIHEISHALGHAQNGCDVLFRKAFRVSHLPFSDWPLEQKKALYSVEKRDLTKMLSLYRQIGFTSVSLHDVAAIRMYDTLIYKMAAQTGSFGTKKEQAIALEFCKVATKTPLFNIRKSFSKTAKTKKGQ